MTYSQLFYDGETRSIKRIDVLDQSTEPRDIKVRLVEFHFNPSQIEGQSIFKRGIQPKWEDEANEKGGEIRVNLTGKI